MLFYLDNILNSHSIQRLKYFYQMILMSPLHCKTQTTWENLFFTVPIKLRMFGGYISITGASMEAKTHVISICLLFYFSN